MNRFMGLEQYANSKVRVSMKGINRGIKKNVIGPKKETLFPGKRLKQKPRTVS
jgi:hypothetical protein